MIHYGDWAQTCSQHYHCFDEWEEHVKKYSHTARPIPGCHKGGVDSGSNEPLLVQGYQLAYSRLA